MGPIPIKHVDEGFNMRKDLVEIRHPPTTLQNFNKVFPRYQCD
jgi:hypothetical protein